MADLYEHFAEAIYDITPKEAEWIETVLVDIEDKNNLNSTSIITIEKDISSIDNLIAEGSWPGFDWQINTNILHITDNAGYWNTEATILFLQAFIQKFRPNEKIGISYAYTCSKPRPREFGGGWLVISANSIKGNNTFRQLEEELVK